MIALRADSSNLVWFAVLNTYRVYARDYGRRDHGVCSTSVDELSVGHVAVVVPGTANLDLKSGSPRPPRAPPPPALFAQPGRVQGMVRGHG